MTCRRKWALLASLFVTGGFILAGPVLRAGDAPSWPQFLGPDRNGIAEGPKLASTWPAGGPRVVWTATCGNGLAGPVVAEGVLVLMERPNTRSPKERETMQNVEETIRGFDADTGKELWRTSNPCAFKGNSYCWGAAATPAISQGKVVCVGIEGRVRCLELKTGKVVWEKDLIAEYQSDQHKHWGVTTSPLIVDGLAIVQICSQAGKVGLVAWKLDTGEEAWRTRHFGVYGTESPGFARLGDVPTIITAGSGDRRGSVFGVDARTGAFTWFIKSNAHGGTAPTVADGVAIFPTGENDDMGMVALRPPASGEGKGEVVWDQTNGHPIRFSAALAYKGLVFGHGYPAHDGPHPFWYADAKDGTLLWSQLPKKEEHQCFIGSDGKVLQMHETGELTLFDADARAGYKELARAMICDRTWAFPALVNGRLYMRTHTRLICLDLADR